MSQSSKILVLGSRGMLGSHVVAAFRSTSVAGVVEHCHPRFPGEKDLKAYLAVQAPTTVVNCLAYTGEDPAEHFKVNAGFPGAIADVCSDANALFIQISTNAVFAPDDYRHWRPADPISPRSLYESSKALGEDPRAYVIRSSFIGEDPRGSGLFNALREGKPYPDGRWNGVTALTLARHIVRTAEAWDGRTASRLEHVHSAGVSTTREVGRALGSPSLPCKGRRIGKLLGGGPALPEIREQLTEYVEWLDHGGREALKGCGAQCPGPAETR